MATPDHENIIVSEYPANLYTIFFVFVSCITFQFTLAIVKTHINLKTLPILIRTFQKLSAIVFVEERKKQN